jgi:hypothetical protein
MTEQMFTYVYTHFCKNVYLCLHTVYIHVYTHDYTHVYTQKKDNFTQRHPPLRPSAHSFDCFTLKDVKHPKKFSFQLIFDPPYFFCWSCRQEPLCADRILSFAVLYQRSTIICTLLRPRNWTGLCGFE